MHVLHSLAGRADLLQMMVVQHLRVWQDRYVGSAVRCGRGTHRTSLGARWHQVEWRWGAAMVGTLVIRLQTNKIYEWKPTMKRSHGMAIVGL